MTYGFIAENWKLKLARHPIEDSYSYNESGTIAVAGGVARDPMPFLPDVKTLAGKLKFAFHYPRPSPAKRVADIFCRKFPKVLRDFCEVDKKAIREAFKEANRLIAYWNKQHIPNPDYVTRDLAGCVAAGLSKQDDYLHWGYICDCGVAIFDEKGDLRFRTEDESSHRLDKHIWQDKRLQNIGWENPEARRIIRSHYRNNPEEEHSFGVLTGEEAAMYYVRTGTEEIKPGEHLIVYSDGLEPIIFSGEFADRLRNRDFKGLRRLCEKRVKIEGTLVHENVKDWREEMVAEAQRRAIEQERRDIC